MHFVKGQAYGGCGLRFFRIFSGKAFSSFFGGEMSDAEKAAATRKVAQKLDHFESILSDGRDFLLGDSFSVADAYLFVVASWTGPTGIGLDKWPHIAAFSERVAKRGAVREALRAEGLLN